MNSQYAAFNPRFIGNTATGTMTQATMYMNYQNGNIGIGTITPGAKLDIINNTTTTGTLLRIAGTGMTMSGNYLQITGSGGRNLLRVSQQGTDPLDIERVIIGQ